MREEHQLLGIILKSQSLGEADSLITWFTQELGKIRTVVVSARRMQSKLGFALLPGTLVAFRITRRTGQSTVLRLIQATPVALYVRDFADGRGLVLQWLQEIVVRATPDEQVNEELFSLMLETLKALALSNFRPTSVSLVMCGVLVRMCELLGFKIQYPPNVHSSYFFNLQAGGFVSEAVSGDDWFFITTEMDRFDWIRRTPIAQLAVTDAQPLDERFLDIVVQFFEYQIERTIQSSRLFGAILE